MELRRLLCTVLAAFWTATAAWAADTAIPDQTELSEAAADNDEAPIYDTSGSAGKSISVLNLLGAPMTGAFDLSDGGYRFVRTMQFTAGEDLTRFVPVYIKVDSGTTKVYEYHADSTDTDNDTYAVIGITVAAVSSGNTATIFVDEGMLVRDDSAWTFAAADVGKPLYTDDGGAGWISTSANAGSGDHNEIVGYVVGDDGTSSVTGNYVLFRVPLTTVVVP